MVSGTLNITSTGATYDINMVGDGTNHYLEGLTIAGGKISFKGRDGGTTPGNSTLNINGNFNMNSGSFVIEEDGELPTTATAIQNFVIINGDFTLSGGTIDLNLGASRGNQGINELQIKGDITMNGGTINQSNAGASGVRYTQRVKFAGTTPQNYSENGTQSIDNYYTYVTAGSTVNLTTNLKICSLASVFPMLFVFGTLNAQDKQIYPTTSNAYSGVYILAGGRVQTSNVNGYFTGNSSTTTLKDNLSTHHTNVIDVLGVVEYNGTVAQAITSGAAKNTDGTALATARNYGILDINNTTTGGSALTMGASVTTDQLRLRDGIVNTAANNLIVLNTAAGASGAIQNHSITSYVNTGASGKLRRYVTNSGYPLSYDFPVGNGNTGSYELMNINITAGNTASYLDVNFDNPSNATGTGLPLTESSYSYDVLMKCGGNGTDATYGNVWTVTPNSGTATYNMSLFGLNNSTWGSGRHTILKRSSSAAAWTILGTYSSGSGSASGITAVRTAFSGFSQFALAKSGALITLPIDFVGFIARCEHSNVLLQWETVSEKNNDFFTIEKSIDGKTFYSIGNIKGAGNSSSLQKYTFTDEGALEGTSYYRLIQTDYDGRRETFNVIPVACAEQEQFNFNILNNPAEQDNISISISGTTGKNASIVMVDALGKEVYSKQILTNSDLQTNIIRFPLSVGPGLYTIIASSENNYISKKIVVQ